MKSPKKNVAESVRARLLNLSKERGDEFHLTLADYAIERFLYRLGQSPLRDRFVLKGAVLFRVWMGQSHRPTKDLDLLGRGSSELSEVADAIREVCRIQASDGVVFDLDGMKAERIREGAEYEGIRIRFRAELAAAQIPLQNDVGFGRAITPTPSLITLPSRRRIRRRDHSHAIFDSRPIRTWHGPSPSTRVSARDGRCGEVARDGCSRHFQHAHEG